MVCSLCRIVKLLMLELKMLILWCGEELICMGVSSLVL